MRVTLRGGAVGLFRRILNLRADIVGLYTLLSNGRKEETVNGRLGGPDYASFHREVTGTLMETIFQQIVCGLALGATYALVALGISWQFRAMDLLNFAHGESFMMGAFFGIGCHVFLKLPLPLAWLLTLVGCGLVGLLIEFLAMRPLYTAPPLNLFICTIALSMILRQTANILTAATAYKFPPTLGESPIDFGGILLIPEQIWVIGVAVVLMFGLDQFLKKTRTGKAMRAVAQDQQMASLMGIDVVRMKSWVYALSTILGGAAGLLFAPLVFVTYDIGLSMGIKGFICAILGGVGNIPGAILGGFILGLLEQFNSSHISSLYKDVISFSIVIVMITLCPKGLLGRTRREKV
jgi:branched-chain amino acid transport system permease protein